MFVPDTPTVIDSARFMLTRSLSGIMRLFGRQYSQLVICGYPRSGTSLLYNMLATTLHEKFIFTEFEKYFMYHIHKLGNIANKAPLDVMHLDYLKELNIHNKRLIVLVMVRDPREIVTSRHPILPDEYFIGHDYSFWPKDKNFNQWEYCAPGVIPISEKIREATKQEYVSILKFEDLISDPDSVQKKISEKYGLSFDFPFSEYQDSSRNLPYQYKGRYSPKDKSLVLEDKKVTRKKPRWMDKKYRERLISQFKEEPRLFDLLIEYGYEEDSSWFSHLVED